MVSVFRVVVACLVLVSGDRSLFGQDDSPVTFANAADAARLEFTHENGASGKFQYVESMGSGVCIFDYDGDGWSDIYLVNGAPLSGTDARKPTNALFRNRHDGTFRDVTTEAGVGDSSYGTGACAADHDGDGDVDLYVLNFGPNVFYRRGCHGNATFSNLAIARGANINITESLFEKRGILHARLDAGDRTIAVLNTHFSLTGRQRRRQWLKLQHVLPNDRAHPILVCGDFNDWSGALDRRARAHGKLHNALWALPKRQRRSFPSWHPVVAIDRIYYRGFRTTRVRVLDGDPWRRLSDHLPVEADLDLEPLHHLGE